jgi:hypothetical protein
MVVVIGLEDLRLKKKQWVLQFFGLQNRVRRGVAVLTLFLKNTFQLTLYRMEWRSGEVLDSYSGSCRFIFRPGHRLSEIGGFMVFLSSSRQIRVVLPRLDHYPFLPNPFQFVTHQPSYHSMFCSLGIDSVIKEVPLETHTYSSTITDHISTTNGSAKEGWHTVHVY